ncbi:MAG TPA: carbohydrate-binding protein [Tepidisphaeraceae bacterium]|jgi:hypothetical protein|nr:carbohydrate-binding protein [Tepidisphaeraceae bacterium]
MFRFPWFAKRRKKSRPAPPKVVEQLESRTMLSVSLNAGGDTVITPSAGDHVIYCSSSTGNDRNSGLSPSSPVQSLAKAESMLRNNTGDEMLLKAGDTFHGDFIYWTLSGKSAQDPMVLGSYGTGARPTILTGTESGFLTGSVGAKVINYVAIMGIHFDADGRDPARTAHPVSSYAVGINILTKSNDITVENCEVENYTVNMNFQDLMGPLTNVTVRNNVIIDAWSADAHHAEGIYVTGVTNFTLTGNLLDHNGWNSKISGAGPTWFNHDAYLSAANVNCVITNNVFSNAAGYGLQARSGGIVSGNVFINDPTAMSFGVVTGASTTAGGVTGTVTNNVFFGGGNIGSTAQGGGMIVGNIKPGAGVVISDNIFTQSITNAAAAITLTFGQGQPNASQSVGNNDVKIENNIVYDWTLGVVVADGQVVGGKGINAINRITVTGNEFENITSYAFENHDTAYNSTETISGNSYYKAPTWRQGDNIVKSEGNTMSSPLPFPDPSRSISSYASSMNISGGVSGFVSKATTQSEQSFNASCTAAALVAYFDKGFATTGGKSTPTTPTPTPPTTSPASSTQSALTTIQALNFNSQHGGLKFDNFKGLGYGMGGDWAEYNQVDFGKGVSTFSADISTIASEAGSIQLRLDSPTGALIGTLKAASTGSWENYTLQSTKVTGATGVHNLYLVYVGGKGVANIESFKFS